MTATDDQRGDVEPHRPGADEYVGEEMSLVEHLSELRSRMFKCAVAIAVGFVVGFLFRQQVFDVIIQPYCELPSELRAGSEALAEGCNLVILDVFGFFFISLKTAAIVAVIIAAPFVCYQIWRFVTPGLRPVERRYALPFVVISQLLFVGGAVFSYYIVPRGLQFLLNLAGPNVLSLMDADRYITFMLRVMLAFGIAFELPLILITLVLMGVVDSVQLRRYRRHALFGIFVAAALITPPDPATMMFMAAPLVVFYEGAVLIARWVGRRRARATS